MGLLDLIKKSSQSGSVAAGAVNAVAVRSSRQPKAVESLPAVSRAKAAEKLRFIRLVQNVKKEQHLSDPEAVELVATTRSKDFPILVKAGKNGSSALIYNNYRNWGRVIRECANDADALKLLADNYNRGRQPLKGDRLFWEYFHAFYLNLNHLPLTAAYRMAVDKMRSIDPNCKVPTLASARYDVANMDMMTVIMAREGETAARNLCVDFIQRDWSSIAAGFCIIGDSRTFDTRVRVWDDANQKWRAVRPTIAALIDARSWYFGAWWITVEPVNTDTLINTLALYCHNTGGEPPAVAYFDNGKDYCAQGFSTPLEVDGHEHSIFQELGIRLQNATPYNGRAKTIERAFRDIMQQFDKMFPDYLGSTPADRSAASDWFDSHAEELPSLEQFCQLFDNYITNYHCTPKHGKIHAGKSPLELWQSREHRQVFSPEQLRFAFLKPEGIRLVKRGPAVAFDNKFYYCDSVQVGDKVLVKSDPLDPTHVILFTIDGRFMGDARTREAINALADEADQELLKSLIARQRKQLADARTAINDLTGGRAQVSPLELLLAPIDAKPRLLGTKSSVKGPSHTFRRVEMPGVITPPQIEFQEDKKQKQLDGFKSLITQVPTEELTSSKEDLHNFNNFMTSRNRDEDDY